MNVLHLTVLATLTAGWGGGSSRATGPAVPEWGELIEAKPNSNLVKDRDARKRVEATGLAWRVRDRATGIEMLLVPPGAYMRGATPELERPPTEELPRHSVMISSPFYLARYETQEKDWDWVFDGREPSAALGKPVGGRRYADVEAFLRRANEKTQSGVNPLRLPSEAEWEYACRAGSERACYGKSLSKVAWFKGNSGKILQIVGEKTPNDRGFSDMLGNAVEWCSDFFDPAEYERLVKEESECVDPVGSSNRSKGHTLRGGGVNHPATQVTSSSRMRAYSGAEGRPYGFRVARNP